MGLGQKAKKRKSENREEVVCVVFIQFHTHLITFHSGRAKQTVKTSPNKETIIRKTEIGKKCLSKFCNFVRIASSAKLCIK